jgi:hypothetical protein
MYTYIVRFLYLPTSLEVYYRLLLNAVKAVVAFGAAVKSYSPLGRGMMPLARLSMLRAGSLAPSPSSYASYGVSMPTHGPRAAPTALSLPAPSPFHPTHIKEWNIFCRAQVLRRK